MQSSDIIAICSGVVALFALGGTLWQAWLARQHNRLSVRPLLVWHVSRDNTSGCAGITYSVRNLGLGPAVIQQRFFTKDGSKFVPEGKKGSEVQAIVDAVLGTMVKYHLVTFGLPGIGAAIASQEEFVIARLEFPGANLDQLSVIENSVANVTFHVDYESMYREPFRMNAT